MDYKGKKTYIVVVATICYALGGAVAGFHDWGFAIPLILGAFGLGALRDSSRIASEQPEEELANQ